MAFSRPKRGVYGCEIRQIEIPTPSPVSWHWKTALIYINKCPKKVKKRQISKNNPQIRNYAPNMIQKQKESASLLKRGHSASNVTIKTYKCPLPHHATWGNTQNHDHKLSVLSKVILEHISISVVAWIDIQHILPWCPDPFGWHRDELEDITDESLESNCSIIEKILQKERVSQVLLLPLSCLSGLIHILICNTKIGEKSDMTKSWATFCCSGT